MTFEEYLNEHVPQWDVLDIEHLKDCFEFQQKKIDELKNNKEYIEKLENLLINIYSVCLCERFETEGFDYHEQHPRRKDNNGGKRPYTPRDMIENTIGFEWGYDSGYGKKILQFKTVEHKGD